MRSTKAIIDLSAIRHNLDVARALAPKSRLMAVVKADAYGHGIVEAAKSLKTADAIAVACMDEALKLRAASITQPIILLEGIFSDAELQLVLQHQLQMVVHQESQLAAIEKIQETETKLNIWLKLDTGMNRLGFDKVEFAKAYQRLIQLPQIESVNLMSHLACADDIDDSLTKHQIDNFSQAIQATQALKSELSLANSAGLVAWPESHFDWVRPGILLYGCSPMVGLNGTQHQLKPAMTLQSQLFSIRDLAMGDSVGYGASWQASAPTRVGVIAIGYGDGYPRHAKPGTPVLINGKYYPLVGKVSMDMLTVDLGLDDQVKIGDKAVLWGKGLPVETVAKHADTIAYTLLCGVTSRVKFEWQE